MKVISTNIGEQQIINWRDKKVKTGIFKYQVTNPIELGKEDVEGDHVIDRKYHGGSDKACYLFSEIHYKYWKNIYPELNWRYGMFGENLTISNLDEAATNIGDIFKLGSALVRVTQPRQPCFKLGVRLGTQKVIKQFVDYGYPGVYVRVLEPGKVQTNDQMKLVEKSKNSISVKEIFKLLYSKEVELKLVEKAIANKALAESCRNDLKKIWNL
jgi:MOSC domain-containing protein YiiM